MSDTTKSVDDELRRQITEIKDRLAGRIETHRKVAKLSGWTPQELENVIREDGWIFEDEIIALFAKQLEEAYQKGFIDGGIATLTQDTKGGTDDTPRV